MSSTANDDTLSANNINTTQWSGSYANYNAPNNRGGLSANFDANSSSSNVINNFTNQRLADLMEGNLDKVSALYENYSLAELKNNNRQKIDSKGHIAKSTSRSRKEM